MKKLILFASMIGLLLTSCNKSDNSSSTPAPVASFTYANGTSNYGAVNFTSTSTNASTYSWNFGDPMSGSNNTSTLQNPTHIFTNDYSNTQYGYGYNGGNEIVQLTVTGSGGSNSTSQTFTVTNGAYLSATYTSGMGNNTYTGEGVYAANSGSSITIYAFTGITSGSGNVIGELEITLPSNATTGTYNIATNSFVGFEFITCNCAGGISYANSTYPCSNGSIAISNISANVISGTFSCTMVTACPMTGYYTFTNGQFGANF
jgi:PKD repeat protein